MTGVAISALPAATTPLAGTELAAIVQSGTTKKVAVSHIGGGSVSGVAGGVAFFDTNTSVTTANPVTNFTWDDGLQILTVTGTIVLGTSSANQASTLLLDSAHQLAWDNGAGGLSFVFKDLGGGTVQLADASFQFTPGANASWILNGSNSSSVQIQDSNGNSIILSAGVGGAIAVQSALGNFFEIDIDNALLAVSPANTINLGAPGGELKSGYFGTSVVTPLITATTGNFSGTVTAAAFVTASLQAAFVASPYGAAAGNTGEYRFLELAANGTDYVALKAPDALAAPLTFTLPAVDHAGPISSNGSGVLSAVAGQDLTIVIPVANKTLTFTKGVLTGVV